MSSRHALQQGLTSSGQAFYLVQEVIPSRTAVPMRDLGLSIRERRLGPELLEFAEERFSPVAEVVQVWVEREFGHAETSSSAIFVATDLGVPASAIGPLLRKVKRFLLWKGGCTTCDFGF